MVPVCKGNRKNDLRACPDVDGTCGTFHSVRANGEVVDGVDIRCPAGTSVHAPFSGEMYYWRPFGGVSDKKCSDEGVRIEGTGQWQGYAVYISSISLNFYGGNVEAGQELGTVKDRSCFLDEDQRGSEYHVQMKLYREGKLVDPTYHLQHCMCTGQICESNSKNRLLGEPFRSDKRYNGVHGWDMECSLIEDQYEGIRAPLIYSPITGEIMGRTRLRYSNDGYIGCDNDAMFIVGTEDWIGFDVHIYNVRTRSDLGFGRKRIVQGEPIGTRLNCDNSPDSIFIEFRYQGRIVDMTDIITATKCQLPSLPNF
ncbi:unnamed protein product [Auanema sp. JU1783]|nr:unnamed protein product [Auanema sp. JU1783]